MALIATMDMEAGSWDIIEAFLNALINSKHAIYVSPPPGYKIFNSNGCLLLWLLLQALYGLHQELRL